jgi:alkylhydroperoxidase/carboxymuconolactone decarboxylase family protein YurZ
MSRISIIQPEEATGRLKGIYDQLEKQRGQIAEVHKMQSLRPESIVKHMEIMFSKSELSRAQREMMAVVVSVTNNCSYCSPITTAPSTITGRMRKN